MNRGKLNEYPKSINRATINVVAICKQLSNFYDTYYEDKKCPNAIDFLSSSIHVDMSQIKKNFEILKIRGSLGVFEYIQKHYSSAILFMNLFPQENVDLSIEIIKIRFH